MKNCYSLLVFPISSDFVETWKAPDPSTTLLKSKMYQIMFDIFSHRKLVCKHTFRHGDANVHILVHTTSIEHLCMITHTLLPPSHATFVCLTPATEDGISSKTRSLLILAKLWNGKTFLLDNLHQKMIEVSSCDNYSYTHPYQNISYIELKGNETSA